jgi:hypothetical protein
VLGGALTLRLQHAHTLGEWDWMSRDRQQSTYLLRSTGGDCNDIFAVNPLRRSAWIVAVSWAMILGPVFLLTGEFQALVLIAAGWLAATGIIMCTPILIWCLIEEGVKLIRRRVSPPIESLDLSPRAYNLLRRHGFESIASVDATPDTSLMLLSNMDARAVREIRRAISIWRYQRWQERGFPADGLP